MAGGGGEGGDVGSVSVRRETVGGEFPKSKGNAVSVQG